MAATTTMRRPLRRLLIANRGEIAVRIARTARRLGMETVGVHSDPDAHALHVDVMDRSVSLPGSTSVDTYLRPELIIEAALRTGCDAVHPGYGFLAENAEFARAVIDAGLVWVGPTPEQIELLGDKVAAKRAAVSAGVPTTPIIEIRDGENVQVSAYPVLVKAAAGGGGRGMRIVRDAAELSGAIAASSREALAAFGDGTVFIEPYVERGRHIEVQVVGDQHGNAVHLFDRECSIQRRNQKVIEEAPSVGIDEQLRERLCEGALALVRSVGYEGVGTVEFFVGADGTVTFLEVNTRLQVEHPVTEAITGLDLVELQLLVAAGEPLPVTQEQVSCRGHAIEVRIVAEDPAREWTPDAGELRRFDIPSHLRVDTGFVAGSVVGHEYDSLLAKVIAHHDRRDVAAAVLARAMRATRIDGVATNVVALAGILEEDDYLAGATFTSYLADHPGVVAAARPGGADRVALLLAAVFAAEVADRKANPHTAFAPSGWRNLRVQGQRQSWEEVGADAVVDVEFHLAGDVAEVLIGPFPRPDETGALGPDTRERHRVRVLAQEDAGRQVLEIDGERQGILVDLSPDAARAHTGSPAGSLLWTRRPRHPEPTVAAGASGPRSDLPGTILAVHVKAGDVVEEGEILVVMEAMKMEHKIRASHAARVVEVAVSPGERVDAGVALVVLGDPGDPGDSGDPGAAS